jgi:L-histidine N-alpha-methyltransferase
MHDATGAAPQMHAASMLAEVRAGLSREQKELPPKFFYDTRGSELFEEITRLPEYYLTRSERALLEQWIPGWVAALRPRSLVELGAGSAEKTRIILDAMRIAGTLERYVPVDVSASFLEQVAAQLRTDYPELQVVAAIADITVDLSLPTRVPHPVVFAFLGSTIGNFDQMDAIRLLRRIRTGMNAPDRFLMGVDLRKDSARIEAAYNDTRGITAEFNRNMLRVLNRELGADFDPAAFDHRAFYNRGRHCIEMHLVSAVAQEVTVPGIGTVHFDAGESIRTEISCKYDRDSVAAMFLAAGLRMETWQTDPDELYAVVVGAPDP